MRALFLVALLAFTSCSHSQKSAPASAQANPGEPVLSADQIQQLQKAQTLREEGFEFLYSKDPRVKNPKKAFEKLLAAAELGDPLAMDSVGGMYSAGVGGVQRSCSKAMQWFERSAASGYGLAANNLAYLYVTCDDKKLRDPGKAETIVKMVLSGNPSVIALLDTYGALLAEQGNFKQAAATMRVVIDLQELIESNPERIDESKQALALYQKKKKLPAGFDPKPETDQP